MRSQRITFLSNILEYNISNGCQLMIANEYYSANDLPIIYNHDEDGLAELCNGMSANEILRASSYGNYSYTEPYVFINAHGNLETSDEVCCNWRTIAEWMIDGGYKNAFDAWNILNNVSENIAEVYPLIVGCIGDAAAYDLRSWSEIYSKIPEVEMVFEGTAYDVPARPEILFALSSEITTNAREHCSEIEIGNAIEYVSQLPAEFKNRIFADLLQIESIREILAKNRSYDDWFLRSGRDWEDFGL